MTHYILITTKDRLKLLNNCIESIKKTTPNSRIFIVSDGSKEDTIEYIVNSNDFEGYVINKTNIGIAPSIEIGLHLINNYHRFRFNEGKEQDQNPWISYVQDDVEFIENNWPETMVYIKNRCSKDDYKFKYGFLSGHDAPEHIDSRKILYINIELNNKTYAGDVRDHIRATHMMAPMSFWMEQLPIAEVDPEQPDGIRGHPSNGRGSNSDWWFLRGHDKSVLKRGMTNLVIPGILKHVGYDNSTWQKNKLPEVI